MGLHKPFDRSFYLIGGATMTSGNSLNLAKGQFGIFDVQSTSIKGAKAVSSFNGQSKLKTYELRLGKTDLPVTRSQNNKSFSSFPFKLENVLDLQVSVPETTEQKVDEVVIGYDGIDDSTAITFKEGDLKKINLELKGEPIGLLGYPNGVNIPVYMEVDNCDNGNCSDCDECADANCAPIIEQAIETLRNHQLRGGTLVTDYVDITPVKECENEPVEELIGYTFYTLNVCDTGDETALSLVQAQFPDLKVVRTARNGATSTYEILQPTADLAPADFVQVPASVLGDCDGCPDGFSEVEGGILYAVTIEDEGVDESAAIEGDFANAVKAGVSKLSAQIDGRGYYLVVATAELSDSEFDALVTALPTITVDLIGETSSICDPESSTSVSWVAGDECNVTTRSYTIDLPDTECGEDRLAELQAAFPTLDISIAVVDPEAEPVVNITGGCKTRYITTVETNMVCEECDPIFEDYFVAEAPASYDLAEWKPVVSEDTSTNCKCGIRFKGKVLEVHPDECLRDELGFVDSSVQIRVSGGYVTEVREGIGEIVDEPFNVEYKSRWKRRTHLGGNLWNDEDRNRVFFTGEARHYDDLVARMFKGEESHIEADKQYVDYALTLRRTHYSQSFSGIENETVTYHILVEVGRHQAVEELLNTLATSAGVSPVQAFGV